MARYGCPADLKFGSDRLAEMIRMIEAGEISSKMGKAVFDELYASGKAPAQIVREKGLAQVSDESALEGIVDRALTDNPEQVAQYKSGRDKVLGYFVGQVMKATSGQANPQVVNKLLRNKLAS